MSRLFELFVKAIQESKDEYKSIERWKGPSRVADLGVIILSEITRTSIIHAPTPEKEEKIAEKES